jgi:uncharacterized protein (DUF302 family)
MNKLNYGYAKTLEATTFEDAVERVTAALAEQGFGVLSTIDIKGAMKKKLDVDFRPYVILGACNPPLAHRALQAEPHIGLLLPCNVVVQQTGDDTVDVSALDPEAIFELVGREEIAPVAQDVSQRLQRALAAL